MKKMKIEILGKLVKKFGKNQLLKVGDKEFVVRNNTYKKAIKKGEQYNVSPLSKIDHVFFNEEGLSKVHIHVTLKELQKMMKQLEKDTITFKKWDKKSKVKFGICIRHLSPDVSFIIDYRK